MVQPLGSADLHYITSESIAVRMTKLLKIVLLEKRYRYRFLLTELFQRRLQLLSRMELISRLNRILVDDSIATCFFYLLIHIHIVQPVRWFSPESRNCVNKRDVICHADYYFTIFAQ